jgi:hypothetical protein
MNKYIKYYIVDERIDPSQEYMYMCMIEGTHLVLVEVGELKALHVELQTT